jgi:hypothetical protein
VFTQCSSGQEGKQDKRRLLASDPGNLKLCIVLLCYKILIFVVKLHAYVLKIRNI